MSIFNLYKYSLNYDTREQLNRIDNEERFSDLLNGNKRIVIDLSSSFGYEIKEALESGKTKTKNKYLVDLNKGLAYKIEVGEPNYLRPIKVGKLIGKELTEEYLNKWSQFLNSKKAEDEVIILSRTPIDMVRMSDFGNNISSCHSPGDSYFKDAVQESADGGMIAYVVRKEDLISRTEDFLGKDREDFDEDSIQKFLNKDEVFEDEDIRSDGLKPLSRLRVTRYVHDLNGSELAVPTTTQYGEDYFGFYDSVKDFLLEKQNINKDDVIRGFLDEAYIRQGGEYVDSPDSSILGSFLDTKERVPEQSHAGGRSYSAVWKEELEESFTDINNGLPENVKFSFEINENYIHLYANIDFNLDFPVAFDSKIRNGSIDDYLLSDIVEYSPYLLNDGELTTLIKKDNSISINIRSPLDDESYSSPDEAINAAHSLSDDWTNFRTEDYPIIAEALFNLLCSYNGNDEYRIDDLEDLESENGEKLERAEDEYTFNFEAKIYVLQKRAEVNEKFKSYHNNYIQEHDLQMFYLDLKKYSDINFYDQVYRLGCVSNKDVSIFLRQKIIDRYERKFNKSDKQKYFNFYEKDLSPSDKVKYKVDSKWLIENVNNFSCSVISYSTSSKATVWLNMPLNSVFSLGGGFLEFIINEEANINKDLEQYFAEKTFSVANKLEEAFELWKQENLVSNKSNNENVDINNENIENIENSEIEETNQEEVDKILDEIA